MGLASSKKRVDQQKQHEWHENTLRVLEYKNELRLEEEKRNEERKRQDRLERSMRISLKDMTIRIGIKSSFPCFPSIFEPKRFHFTRIVWILLTILSIAYWIYQTYTIYQLYISYQVVSSYSQKIETKPTFPCKSLILFLF
jgi:hypothetical protein